MGKEDSGVERVVFCVMLFCVALSRSINMSKRSGKASVSKEIVTVKFHKYSGVV